MEHSMRLVEEHCAKYLTMFGECVHQFPHTWQMDCEPQRRKLARCAETNPEILHIKSTCAEQFSEYEKCMRENKSDSDLCTAAFNVFSICAKDALATYTRKATSTPTASSVSKVPPVTETVNRSQTRGGDKGASSYGEEPVVLPFLSGISQGIPEPKTMNQTPASAELKSFVSADSNTSVQATVVETGSIAPPPVPEKLAPPPVPEKLAPAPVLEKLAPPPVLEKLAPPPVPEKLASPPVAETLATPNLNEASAKLPTSATGNITPSPVDEKLVQTPAAPQPVKGKEDITSPNQPSGLLVSAPSEREMKTQPFSPKATSTTSSDYHMKL